MKTISLNGIWNLKGCEQRKESREFIEIPAKVPGCVQLDLSQNGYLPKDLYMGENITETEKYETYEWWYETSFDSPEEKENIFLVFEGVDCIAEYFLNDVKIGESNNMFISHEFKIDDYIKSGVNKLVVHLKSDLIESDKEDYYLKLLLKDDNLDSRYLRKAPHMFGWDIFPRAVTQGLWRDVKIEVRDKIRLTQVFFHPNVIGKKNAFRFVYTLECDRYDFENIEIEITGSCSPDSKFSKRIPLRRRYGSLEIEVKNLKKWYPYGYGDANVYDAVINVYKDGKIVHTQNQSFGIRDVVLDRNDGVDGEKGQFRFLINGIEVMCKGSNWVPMDAFHCRDKERYKKALELVKDSNCNILRCWGGNVYEDHEFYDFCDRNGIMVWQDFSMACTSYPENKEFMDMMEKEATFIIRKLRNHPSIILWSGDNEVDACTAKFFNTDTNSVTRKLLPKCVELNDYGRPYLASSPYISKKAHELGARSQQPNSPLVEDHLWGPRDYHKGNFYKHNKAHFVSETGYLALPNLNSIKKFITSEHLWPYKNDSEWICHSSDQKGNNYRLLNLELELINLFGYAPDDMEECILASQISQAEAKKYFIERMRVARPEKTGIIWWNLIDGWPQMSDAVVDYYYEKKLAYYYIKRSQLPFIIAADELDASFIRIVACNDTLTQKEGTLVIKDALTDEILYNEKFIAKENTSTTVTNLHTYYSEKKILVFEWEINGEKGFNHYLCGFPPVSLDMYKEFMNKYKLDK